MDINYKTEKPLLKVYSAPAIARVVVVGTGGVKIRTILSQVKCFEFCFFNQRTIPLQTCTFPLGPKIGFLEKNNTIK